MEYDYTTGDFTDSSSTDWMNNLDTMTNGSSADTLTPYTDSSAGAVNSNGGGWFGGLGDLLGSITNSAGTLAAAGLGAYGSLQTMRGNQQLTAAQLAAQRAKANQSTALTTTFTSYLPWLIGGGLLIGAVILFRSITRK